jgi:hypothetical protein
MHRFIPEMVSFAGFHMAEVSVNHRARVAGKSKYGISRTFRVILDLMTILFLRRYSDRPMHLFGSLGLISGGVGGFTVFYLLAAKIGAGILFYPTAIGWHPSEREAEGTAQHDAWRTMQRAHAIANGVYVVACNRVGHEPSPDGRGEGLEFWGGSFIADPFGRILAEAPHDEEAILVAECDPAEAEQTRRHWPFLRDRRIDAYDGITRRFLDK